MSTEANDWVWKQPLPPNSKIVLLALAKHADADGYCWPRIRVIAEQCCQSARTVQRALKDLETKGYLRVQQRYRSDGSQSSNGYHLSLVAHTKELTSPTDKSTRGDDNDVAHLVPTVTHPLDTIMSPLEPPINQNKELPQPLPCIGTRHTPPPAPVPGATEKGAHGALVWPSSLSEISLRACERILHGIDPEGAQTLLDELEGAMATGSIRTSEVRWFRAVVQVYRDGEFEPAAALAIQAKRHHDEHKRTPQARPKQSYVPSEKRSHYLKQINRTLGRKGVAGE